LWIGNDDFRIKCSSFVKMPAQTVGVRGAKKSKIFGGAYISVAPGASRRELNVAPLAPTRKKLAAQSNR
jgi:hypothetical protein